MIVHTDSAKVQAARAGAELVQDGLIVDLGSGSTAALMIRHLASRVASEGVSITCIPTSAATSDLASGLEIPLRDLGEVERLDISLDGADEIDSHFR